MKYFFVVFLLLNGCGKNPSENSDFKNNLIADGRYKLVEMTGYSAYKTIVKYTIHGNLYTTIVNESDKTMKRVISGSVMIQNGRENFFINCSTENIDFISIDDRNYVTYQERIQRGCENHYSDLGVSLAFEKIENGFKLIATQMNFGRGETTWILE